MRVCVIGCGINGGYIAWKLAKLGHSVTVYDKKTTFEDVVCSGLISRRLWDFIPENRKLVDSGIDYMLLHFPKKIMRVEFYPKMLVIERSSLDEYAAGLAKHAGAKIHLGHKFKSFRDLGGKVEVTVEHNSKIIAEEFDYMIGSDGPSSEVRKQCGFKDPPYRIGIYFYDRTEDKNNFVDVWPLEKGFIWKIPRGKSIEYGIIEEATKANAIFRDFCREHNLKIGSIKSALIPEGFKSVAKGRIAICGDAAGLTKPPSGGGIIWGMFAANLLVENFPDFKAYERKAKKFFHPRLVFSSITERAVVKVGNNYPFLLPKKNVMDADLVF
ncbi:MAG TPA: FAD-dependent monooxygenase [archaeon]|nr:FAD-dependent monooxygenase [archaeon]